jgi:hypothetical protein
MKTLIQGGWVVGFDGKEHEVIKGGEVVYDGNRIEFMQMGPNSMQVEAIARLRA